MSTKSTNTVFYNTLEKAAFYTIEIIDNMQQKYIQYTPYKW